MKASYAEATIDGAIRDVLTSGNGARNTTLFAKTCRALEHANACGRATAGVLAQLREAALASGLPSREVDRTLRSARDRVGGRVADIAEASAPLDLANLFRSPAESPQDYRRVPQNELDYAWELASECPGEVLRTLSGTVRPNIHPGRVADLDLVRVLAEDAHLPPWGSFWPRVGLRVLARLFDRDGRFVALRARSLGPMPEGQPKERPPTGYSVGGAVVACPLAVAMFEGDAASLEHVRRVGLVVTEGTPSWLAWCSHFSDANEDAPAAVGYYSGAWTRGHAEAVPDGARVILDPDRNAAGQRMLARIVDSFDGLGARLEIFKGERNG